MVHFFRWCFLLSLLVSKPGWANFWPNFDRLKDLWFENPKWQPVSEDLPIKWLHACPAGKKRLPTDSQPIPIIRSTLQVSLEKSLPQDMHVKSVTKFWNSNAHFFQWQADWSGMFPPSYDIELLRFSLSDLSGNPETRQAWKNVDLRTVYSLLSVAPPKTAKEGSLIIQASVPTAHQDELHRLTLLNHVPIEWQAPEFHCRKSWSLKAMVCRCLV